MPRSPVASSPLPPRRLFADDVIKLRLHRVVSGGSARPQSEQFYAHITEYWFTIHRRGRRRAVGRIGFRIANDALLSYTVGHAGYYIAEAHRGHGYATRALRLIIGLARHWKISPLWVLIEPHNIASRRTAENADFTFIDTIATAPQVMSLGCGPQLCRYEILTESSPMESTACQPATASEGTRFLVTLVGIVLCLLGGLTFLASLFAATFDMLASGPEPVERSHPKYSILIFGTLLAVPLALAGIYLITLAFSYGRRRPGHPARPTDD